MSTTFSFRRFLAVLLTLSLGFAANTPSWAQNGDGEEEQERQEAKSLEPAVAKRLLGAYEKLRNDKPREALPELNDLLSGMGEDMKPFDLASVLQIRGQIFVNLERMDDALRDFERALEVGGLPPDQNTQLRYNVAQLHFQNGDYRTAIRIFEQWMSEVEEPSANAYYMLAAAYYNLDEYEQAVPHAEQALRRAEKLEKSYFDLANILYAQTNRDSRRIKLLEYMARQWPGEKSYWKQLAGIYNENDRPRDAFAALEIAYRTGLTDEPADIKSLAQFYSRFNNPHRGAELLVKEMREGTIERSVDNLTLLSQLYSQAREHKKAIPVLRAAAQKSDSGELSFRLGQVLFADEQSAEAEKALLDAINKGGLSEKDLADAWLLLGNARFNQAEPGDAEQRRKADEAYKMAQRFERTRERAQQWRSYIQAVNRTEQRQAELEKQQEQEMQEAAQRRNLTACRAQQLSGAGVTERCKRILEEAEQAEEE